MSLPTATPVATNQEIDEAILAVLSFGVPLRSVELGARLRAVFTDSRLKPAGANASKSPLWNAQELGNRSCQRLRRAGRIAFISSRGWELNQRKGS